MYDRILVPTDGSDVAATAAEAAVSLAREFDATVHAVHVLELGELPPGMEDEGADELAHRGERATAAVTELAADAGVEATAAILEGDQPIHRVLIDYADEHDVDVVVMGTHGRTGIDRFVLGSVAERLLRESPVPVLTVHEETVADTEFEEILVPTDGSDCAQAAVEHAIDLSLATGGVLHAVHVVDVGAVPDDDTAGAVLDALEERGELALEWAVNRARKAGVSSVRSSVLSGAPHDAIVTYADEYDVDVVVMGTHGRTGVDRYLLGSVTERVVRLTDVPVLGLKDRER